jgi:hypothetical protein
MNEAQQRHAADGAGSFRQINFFLGGEHDSISNHFGYDNDSCNLVS